jgi:hypothetical protein
MFYWFLSVIYYLFPHSPSIWGNSRETFGIFFAPKSTNIHRFPLPRHFSLIARNANTHWFCAYFRHFPIFSRVELEGNE